MATEQDRNDDPRQNSPDYEKLVRREPEGINEGQTTKNVGDPAADPMTSRTPDKVQQQKDQEKQGQNKDDAKKVRRPYTL